MKKRWVVLLMVVLGVACKMHAVESRYYFYYKNGTVMAYPKALVGKFTKDDTCYRLALVTDSVVVVSFEDVDSVSYTPPVLPCFYSYKFNDKYNEQLTEDVFPEEEDIALSDTLHLTVHSAIGKNLTASYNLDALGAVAYVGEKMMRSKQSRIRFDGTVTYTLTYPGYLQLACTKVCDEVWSNPEGAVNEIELTAEMLGTNAPSGRGEGLDKLVDDNPATFFHSTWSNDPLYEKLPSDSFPYIDVVLPRSLSSFCFYYQTRIDASNRNPYAFNVYASDDGASWNLVATFDALNGMPVDGAGVEFTSTTIELDEPCAFLRFEQVACAYKNYLVLSTFKLFEVTPPSEEAVLLQPAVYDYRMIPFGREVAVCVDFLTDRSTGVPRIDIATEGGEMISSKENYLNAYITIQGNGVFPDFADSVQIKGRGNTSWSSNPWAKNPYRLKFAQSVRPFGLKKGKNWNLIAQSQTGSMMSNVMAQKIARMVGTAGANHTIPVDLYINGNYRGSYMFTEKVGLANNSIDLEDESTAVLLELDTYYDEPYRFKSYSYNLPVNVKEPELDEELSKEVAEEKFAVIKNRFNNFVAALYAGDDVSEYIDVEMFARFMLVNELVLNMEICHPKSTYLYNENIYSPVSPFVFGPTWDFDWAFGYENSRSYCVTDAERDLFSGVNNAGNPFFRALRDNSDNIRRAYYNQWVRFMNLHLEELLHYAEDYIDYANSSFVNNRLMWNDHTDYKASLENMRTWFSQRAAYIFSNLKEYDLVGYPTHILGDVNADAVLNIADIVCVVNYLLGMASDEFEAASADINADDVISQMDVLQLLALVMESDFASTYYYALPESNAALTILPFELVLGEGGECRLTFAGDVSEYSALQFDVQFPPNVQLQGVSLDSPVHTVSVQPKNTTCSRILIYSNESEVFEPSVQITLQLNSEEVIAASDCRVTMAEGVLVDRGGNVSAIPSVSESFTLATGLVPVASECHVAGGRQMIVSTLVPQTIVVYDLQGRVVLRCEVEAGTTYVPLPDGIYIVNRTKVIIHNR